MSSFKEDFKKHAEGDDIGTLFLCECKGELVAVYRDKKHPEFIELSIWSLGAIKIPLSIKNRLRYCWHILRHGVPYADQILLTPDKAKELASKIFEIAVDEASSEDK